MRFSYFFIHFMLAINYPLTHYNYRKNINRYRGLYKMLHALIFTFKILVIFGYAIVGITLFDFADTTLIADMNIRDFIICGTGSLFVLSSIFALFFISNVKA